MTKHVCQKVLILVKVMTDKTVTVNSLPKFYIDLKLKVHTLYPVRFLIDGGSAVNALNNETFLKISKQSPELKLNKKLNQTYIIWSGDSLHMVRRFPP